MKGSNKKPFIEKGYTFTSLFDKLEVNVNGLFSLYWGKLQRIHTL